MATADADAGRSDYTVDSGIGLTLPTEAFSPRANKKIDGRCSFPPQQAGQDEDAFPMAATASEGSPTDQHSPQQRFESSGSFNNNSPRKGNAKAWACKTNIISSDTPDLHFTHTRSWGSSPRDVTEARDIEMHLRDLPPSPKPLSRNPTGETCASMAPEYDEDEDECENDDTLEMEVDTGIYTAVVLAAFTGVFARGFDGAGSWTSVHPLVILALCMPLFISQMSAMLALRLGMKLSQDIRDMGHPGNQQNLVILKVMMTLCLQMMTFSYLMRTLKLLVFVLNPLTWIDVLHYRSQYSQVSFPWQSGWFRRCMFCLCHPVVLSICSTLACMMRFVVGYMVHIDSVSIILAAEDVRGAIFDSMAVTFITELQVFYWETCQYVFRIQTTRGFRFMVNHSAWTDGGDLTESERERLVFPGCVRFLGRWWPFLRLGRGVSSFQSAIIYLLLFLLYARQILVVAFALQTRKLPVARDVCTTWKWLNHGEARLNPAAIAFRAILYVSPLDLQQQTADLVHNSTMCDPNGEFNAMAMKDIEHMVVAHPGGILGGVALVCVLLLGRIFIALLLQGCQRSGARPGKGPDSEASFPLGNEEFDRSTSFKSARSPHINRSGSHSSNCRSSNDSRSLSWGRRSSGSAPKSPGELPQSMRRERRRDSVPRSWMPFLRHRAADEGCVTARAPRDSSLGQVAELRELQTSLLSPGGSNGDA
eukprot:CAMPEP_0178448930 /NCGR_PEP_ID=MMETSP0689_2-20121128/42259_1 /TAXON_ID=160604 /ORGANISM="Amphidinium massartii, Strain CS-259" /LENGTH=705 /DNA_ID=CAMNT_0020074173 /DNA_START=135 /DNA_END=2253 /DNA_ORIENTATION=-